MTQRTAVSLSRRGFLTVAGAGAVAAAVGLRPGTASADAAAVAGAIKKLIGDRTPKDGVVKIQAPQIAENGAVVPLKISVASPMTAADHVKGIHVFVVDNPRPDVASFWFTPDCGAAEVSFRCRMAKTSQVVAVAEMSNGAVYRSSAEVKVTIGGCGG